MRDLDHATCDDLIQIILEQRDALADRDRQIAALRAEHAALGQVVKELTAQVGTLLARTPTDDEPPRGTPQGMPGLKPTEPPVREPRPRKPRATGVARRRMAATVRVAHALASGPDCGAPLAGGTVKRTRAVIDLPPGAGWRSPPMSPSSGAARTAGSGACHPRN